MSKLSHLFNTEYILWTKPNKEKRGVVNVYKVTMTREMVEWSWKGKI